jgi:ribosomal protein S18 acetylase RimI-like enzyme
MFVEKADLDCLSGIDVIRAACIGNMRAAGIDQWDEIYPTVDVFHRDCVAGNLFVLRNTERQLIGCATLDQTQSPEYLKISWLINSEQIGVVHRLMISPEFQGKGYAHMLMKNLENEARQRGYQAIRLDAYLHNPSALRLYAALSYRRAGEVQFRKGAFACLEKQL